MDITIHPGKLSGTVQAIPSKSQAHRLLICAAFSQNPTTLICPATNQDIEATADCLRSLGAAITKTESGYEIIPVSDIPEHAVLNCRESGSTLRFMLPIAAALGINTTFLMYGRLPDRPLSPLWEELERMGCQLNRPQHDSIHLTGKLHSGEFFIDGGVSSQFITGLLFALMLLPGSNKLTVTGKIESAPYIRMTEEVMKCFGVSFDHYIFNHKPLQSPGTITVEGDWSNGAFFLGAKVMGNEVTVLGLDENSAQGDKAAKELMDALNNAIQVHGQDIPDLIPILAVVAGSKHGARFSNIGRLRLKESDRIQSVSQMLTAFGAKVTSTEDSLTVFPSPYHSCIINANNDHRIAMAAAIGATVADGPVTILGADCVKKSYPDFWSEFQKLGGKYEQYIR